MFDTRDPSFLDRFLLINALGIKGVNPVFGPSVRQLRLHFNSEFTLVWNVIRLHPLTRRGRGRERERRMTFHFRHFITQQDGRMKRTAKPDREITCVFYRNLHFTPMFSGPLQKDLFKGKWSLAKSCFKQNYYLACRTKFAAFFHPLPSCCVSSLMLDEVRSP